MPVIKSVKKALRSSARKKVYNDRRRRALKEAVKVVRDGATAKKDVREFLPAAYKAIDKAVKRGVIKKNTASRKKSRLVKLVRAVSAK
ncbi:MAG: 30S ribosomal protein S20 [Candidatus Lloydbacteria bacterium CG22_combo_CG10-13_8_21_14_all_47_15]|uniref:Small ribosomal subunit protein bS20 n=1 Tax=Candidatus Lloydbacteria bacterium CG22_combo_CG10-13_8_21_14_all_47_15 TaxID=1974635 RepID=A0A2H0CUD4_9BACT|nr:MAG: 30S ribosomal protein S20 [Candidatus Lloydbacteria bacterium CG22_combo_CG10-13_8_21_14_all_47_15]